MLYITNSTKTVDLNGKVVFPGLFPGFIDSHRHVPGTALTQLYSIYLSEAKTKEAALQVIRDFVEKNPNQQRYFGSGYLQAIGGDPRGPKKEWLDEISKDEPIYLTSSDGHVKWLNSAALAESGITKDTTVPAGGSVPLTEYSCKRMASEFLFTFFC